VKLYLLFVGVATLPSLVLVLNEIELEIEIKPNQASRVFFALMALIFLLSSFIGLWFYAVAQAFKLLFQ